MTIRAVQTELLTPAAFADRLGVDLDAIEKAVHTRPADSGAGGSEDLDAVWAECVPFVVGTADDPIALLFHHIVRPTERATVSRHGVAVRLPTD